MSHSQSHLDTLSILVTDALFTNGGPHITYANQTFCDMTGYSLEELLGKSPRILQGKLTDPAVIDRLRESLQNHEYFIGSTVNYRKDGKPYEVEWNITPVLSESGKVESFISIQQDLRAVKKSNL